MVLLAHGRVAGMLAVRNVCWFSVVETGAQELGDIPKNSLLASLFRFRFLGFLLFLACCSYSQVNPPARAHSPATADSDFGEAKRLFVQGSFDKAAAAAKRGLEHSPRNVAGLNLLGVIYHHQGNYSDAITILQQALTVSPHSVDTLNNLGTSYAAQGKTDAAERMFRQTLLLDRGNPIANHNLGLILLGRNRPKEAILYFSRVHSPDVATRLDLIRAYFIARMIHTGLATAEKISQRLPKDTRVHFTLGVLLGSNRQYTQAVREFELANALQPQTFDILHDLGQAYVLSSQPAKAQQPLSEALQLRPDSANTLYLLAHAAADMQKDVDALDLLVRARKIAPNDTDVLFLMARLSMKQSFFEDAIQLLNEGVQIDPQRADFHAALGDSYFTVGKVDKALQEFKTLVSLDPSPRSFAFMGLCYRHLGQYEKAKTYLNESLKAAPRNLPALFNLGVIAKKQGDLAQAEQFWARALRIDSTYPDVLLELGSLKMEQKKFDEAIPLLRRCTQVSQKPAQAYYKLALAERGSHQMEAAARDMSVFQTLSKNPQPGPYPLQHFFDYLERRNTLSPEQQKESDLQELQAEVQQNPDRPRGLFLLAEAFLKLGRTADAMQVIKRLDEVSGFDFRTELSVGVLLGRFHLYEAAVQHFEAAIKANPASDDARYNLAEAYLRSDRYQDALDSLLQLTPEAQKDSSCLALLGDVYAHLGRTTDAARALQQAIANSPDNDRYYVSLAVEQLRAGDVERAKRTVGDGLSRIPDSGVLYWAAGLVAVVEGNARKAESYLAKAVDLMPWSQTAFASLGVFYYEAGRIPEARETLQRYTEMFPQAALDVQKINATLDAASGTATSQQESDVLSPAARQEFYELALVLSEQER